MTLTDTRMTLTEFLALPEVKPALEYENGEVSQKVSPKGRHILLQVQLVLLIHPIIRPSRAGQVFTELRATFAGMSRVPDVAVYLWDRIPRDERGEIEDDFTEPPDVAFEIVSPGQSVNRLLRRCLSFVANGVKAAVLIDPADRSITVIRGDGVVTVLTAGETLDLNEIIPGLRVAVNDVFDALKV